MREKGMKDILNLLLR